MIADNHGLPFQGFSEEERNAIGIIVSDVDDTITKNGKLYPDALRSLWRLKKAGKMIVLLTGGSAGWADCYIRQWPVDAVIAESGAIILAHSKGGDIVYRFNPMIDPGFQKKKEGLLKLTAGLQLSSDQYARIYDIAYDKKKLSGKEIKTLESMVRAAGGHCSESSIHINAGFGNYSKRSSLLFFLNSLFDISADTLLKTGIYFGDSLNDEDMFALLPLSVGMHSVEDMRGSFSHLPKYITSGYGGDGFNEAVESLLTVNPENTTK